MSNTRVILTGCGPNVDAEAQVDRTHRASRFSLRPWEHDAGGHYRIAGRSGALTGTGVTAAGPLFSLRWSSTDKACALLRLRAFYIPTTVFTAAQELGLDLVHVTGFTASDSAGTAIVPTAMRKGMPSSAVTDCRIAPATILTAGTRVVDTTSVLEVGGGVVNVVNAAAATAYINPTNASGPLSFGFDYDPLLRGEMPLILMKDEGFLVRNTVVFPAAGVATLVVVASIVEFPTAGQVILPAG